MLKKITAILFVALFTYQSVGYILFYQYQQVSYQFSEWKKISEEKNSTSIMLNANDKRIQKLNGHEILFEGNRYDIRREKNSSGDEKIICYRDSGEELILKKIVSAFSQSKKSNSPTPASTDFFSKIFKCDFSVSKNHLLNQFAISFSENFSSEKNFITQHHLNIFSPPPEIV